MWEGLDLKWKTTTHSIPCQHYLLPSVEVREALGVGILNLLSLLWIRHYASPWKYHADRECPFINLISGPKAGSQHIQNCAMLDQHSLFQNCWNPLPFFPFDSDAVLKKGCAHAWGVCVWEILSEMQLFNPLSLCKNIIEFFYGKHVFGWAQLQDKGKFTEQSW